MSRVKDPALIIAEQQARIEELREDLKVAAGRLSMAQAYGHMLAKAVRAALHHSVDYMTLAAYHDHETLDKAKALAFHRGVDLYMGYIQRLESAIEAAVRRKQFVAHPGGLLH